MRSVLAVLIAGTIPGLLAGCAFGGGATQTVTVRAATTASPTTSHPARPPRSDKSTAASAVGSGSDGPPYVQQWQIPLSDALQRGVYAADQRGGTAAAAIWAADWPAPLVAGSAERVDRMWSMSKPVASIALLKSIEALGDVPPASVTTAIHWAIAASDNCAMHYIEFNLQQASGSAALSLVQNVLRQAGIDQNETVTAAPDATCDQRLPWGAVAADFQTLELGTYTWTITDAVRFAHALITGVYGQAGRLVAEQMRLPKQTALLSTPADYTSPLDEPPSGGNVFPASWQPGFKGGWGGSTHDDFLAGQMVILNIRGIRIGLAAEFWPSQEPMSGDDDPGTTVAPEALEVLFSDVSSELQRLEAQR